MSLAGFVIGCALLSVVVLAAGWLLSVTLGAFVVDPLMDRFGAAGWLLAFALILGGVVLALKLTGVR